MCTTTRLKASIERLDTLFSADSLTPETFGPIPALMNMPLPIPSSLTVWARGPHVGIWFAVCLDPGAWVLGCSGDPHFVIAALDRVHVDEPIIIRDPHVWVAYLTVQPAKLAYELAMELEDVTRPRAPGAYTFVGCSQFVIPPGLSSAIGRYVLARRMREQCCDADPTIRVRLTEQGSEMERGAEDVG